MRNESDILRSTANIQLDAQCEPYVVFQGDIALNPGREWDHTSIALETRLSTRKNIHKRREDHLIAREEFKISEPNFVIVQNKKFKLNTDVVVNVGEDGSGVVSNTRTVDDSAYVVCCLNQLKIEI